MVRCIYRYNRRSVCCCNWVSIQIDNTIAKLEEDGWKVSREHRRKIARQYRHNPAFTKAFCTSRATTKEQKRSIQFEAIKFRLEKAGVWEYRKYYFEPYKSQLQEELRIFREMAQSDK